MIVIMFAAAMMLAMLVSTAIALHTEATRSQFSIGAQKPAPFGFVRDRL
jgi:hypothetical protein